MNEIESIEDGHLTDELAAGWLDGELTAEERGPVADHLAACDPCREAMAELRQLLKPLKRGRRPVRLLVPAAAAAAAIIWVAGPMARDDAERIRGDSGATERTADVVQVIAPAEGALDAGMPRFVWHTAGADVQYTLTLTDEAGSVVWTTSTQDTALTLPASVRLERDRRYFWYVDALLDSGETATSGVLRFETAP
jgi:predicted anti-sigma-YlaC factor YlaD